MVVALGATVAAGCARQGADHSAAACRGPEGVADGPMAIEPASYRLTLVATSGDSAEKSIPGHIQLREAPDSIRDAASLPVPFVGFGHVQFEALGGSQPPNLDSVDPPGLSVGWDGRGSAVMWLGRVDGTGLMFDGPTTMMHATHPSPAGFNGTWSSGLSGSEVRGYFCAVREADEG